MLLSLLILIVILILFLFLGKYNLYFPFAMGGIRYETKNEEKLKKIKLILIYCILVIITFSFIPKTPKSNNEMTEYNTLTSDTFNKLSFKGITRDYYLMEYIKENKEPEEIRLKIQETMIVQDKYIELKRRECKPKKEFSYILGLYVNSDYCKNQVLNIIKLTEREGL